MNLPQFSPNKGKLESLNRQPPITEDQQIRIGGKTPFEIFQEKEKNRCQSGSCVYETKTVGESIDLVSWGGALSMTGDVCKKCGCAR